MAIKDFRKETGITAIYFAQKVGIKYRRYLCIENGEVNPTPLELKAIAAALHTTIEDLIG